MSSARKELDHTQTVRGPLFELLSPPVRTLTMEVRVPLERVVERLQRMVEPRRLVRNPLSFRHRRFQGSVSQNGFKISRVIHYSNAFLPIVIGHFETTPDGTRVFMTMRMNLFVEAVMLLFMVAFASVTLTAIIGNRGGTRPLFGLGLLAFTYLVCSIPFALEARRARRLLREIFQSE